MIVGFAGQIGSGKDEAANRFVGAGRISFARKLKVSAAACWGGRFDPIEFETWKNDPNVKVAILRESSVANEEGFEGDILFEETAREFLQHYGTKAHRGVFGGDFWVVQAMKEYDDNPHGPLLYCCTDVRFPEEAQAIIDRGGIVVKLLGPDDRRFIEVFDPETRERIGFEDEWGRPVHQSETALFDWEFDAGIDNTRRDDNFLSLDVQLRALQRKHSLIGSSLVAA